MPRQRWHPRSCRECGARAQDGVHISATGLCPACGDRRLLENINGLATMSGEPAQRWRRAMAACVGGILVDDVHDEA